MKRTFLFSALIILLLSVPFVSLAQVPKEWFDSEDTEHQMFINDLSELFTDIDEWNVELYEATTTGDQERVRQIIIDAIERTKRFREKYRDFPIRIEGFSIGFPSGITINIGVL